MSSYPHGNVNIPEYNNLYVFIFTLQLNLTLDICSNEELIQYSEFSIM